MNGRPLLQQQRLGTEGRDPIELMGDQHHRNPASGHIVNPPNASPEIADTDGEHLIDDEDLGSTMRAIEKTEARISRSYTA